MEDQIRPPEHPSTGTISRGSLDVRRLEIGLIGRLFGSASEKPGNIAGFVAVAFSMTFIYFLLYGSNTQEMSKKEALAIIGGFISLAMGFIFGRSTRD